MAVFFSPKDWDYVIGLLGRVPNSPDCVFWAV